MVGTRKLRGRDATNAALFAGLLHSRAPAVAVVALLASVVATLGIASPRTPPTIASKRADSSIVASSHATKATASLKQSTPPHAVLAQNDASRLDSATPVVRALLAGKDARAAVADALAQPSPDRAKRKGKAVAANSAFGSYAEGVRQVQRALAAHRAAWPATAAKAARSHIADALATLHARRLLVDARIEQIDQLVSAPSMPGIARQRWQAHRATLGAAVSRLDDAVQQVSAALAADASGSSTPLLGNLEDLITTETRASAPPTYAAATLPMYRPRLAARDPLLTPAIQPSYANATGDDTPLAADYAASEDAPQSAAILAQAQALGNDYTRIFDFVRSQVRTQWYAGAQKGADATLATMAGNDVDQASLLIALLRASGAPARYVRGVLDVPVDDLVAALGVRADAVGLALGAAGVPNKPLVKAGRISAFAIEHVYVSAYLPFANYRGSSADLDGRAWVPLAPAIKPHAFVPAAGALARLGIDAAGFVQQYLSSVQTASPLDLLRQQVSDGLSQLAPPLAYADQLARQAVNAPPIELLPASLPLPVEAVTAEFAQLPEAWRQHARIVVRAGSGDADAVVFDRVFAIEQLVGHRVTLSYQPASIDDGRIADQHGGLGATPPYLVHVRPIISIAGLPAAAGTGGIETGATHRVEITLEGPAGSASVAQQVTAGGIAALVFDAQDDRPVEQPDASVLPGESESAAARVLANFGARYLASWDQSNDELARLIGVGVVRPFPSVALVINQYRVDRIAGVADALIWRGVGLDAALRPVEPFTQSADNGAAAQWMELASLQGSVLEHQQFEQQWAVDSISADKGLALARASGQPVLTLTIATGISGVNQPQSVLDDISAWLARGYMVEVPRDPITYEAWSGAVWRVHSLPTGESGYFISGALAGGSTAMPPELWYFQDLAELLANPYAQNPDTDPLSGVALSIDASTQYQEGVAGTELAQPLRASVSDAIGRPVLGAAVQFAVTGGTAKLLDADGQETTQGIYLTDRNGIASVRVRLGTSQGDLGNYRIAPGKIWPQWIGHNQIEVSAASNVGALYAGQPYIEFTLPDVPSKVVFRGSEDITLTPDMSYSAYTADVNDQYGNEVSNVPMTLGAATQYVSSSCGSVGGGTSATLFTPGQCPSEVVQLTGNACAQASLATMSQPGGAAFFVVPPQSALARVTVTGSAAGASASLNLSTNDALFDGCHFSAANAVVLWAHSAQHGYAPLLDEYMTLLDAAPPGQVMPAVQRVDAFHAEFGNGGNTQTVWTPVDNAVFNPQLQNGSLENVRGIGGGSYLQDLRAGPVPGPVHGQVYLQWNNMQIALRGAARPSQAAASSPSYDANDLVFAWSVDLRAPEVTPARIPLTPFGATDTTIHLQSKTLLGEYIAAPVVIDVLQGDDVVASCANPVADGPHSFCEIPRGMLVDTTKSYSVRVVLNDGNPFRLESPRTPLVFGQGIIAGYGVLPKSAAGGGANGSVADELALVQGRYPKSLPLRESIDVPSGYSCTVGTRLAYLLSQDATVTLLFHKLDSQGNPSPITAWTALDAVPQVKGLRDVLVTSADLPIGDFQYELKATAADGSTEDYTGVASHHPERHDSLPLGHPFVKGVDLYSGGAVVTEDDIAIGGRGPGLKLTRTYASHQGDERGFFGRGWSADLDSQVLADDCGTRVVVGAAGQGQRYAPSSVDADGTAHFTALAGYHGTLIQKGAEYDFYAKDGTRYHFGQFDTRGPRLSYVEDTNGNRVAYTYEVNQGIPHATRIEDSAGRHIDLTYAIKDVETQQSGFTISDSFTVVTDVSGPGGLHVHYDYDDTANLSKVTRSDASSGASEHGYAYTDLGGIYSTDPDGNLVYYHFGYRLKSATNLLDNGVRSYAYQLGWSGLDAGAGKTLLIPEQRVVTVTEPDGGVTGIAYDGLRGLAPVATDVTDARTHATHYGLNRYGAAETVTDPAGTTTTVWDMAALQPKTITDALGRLSTFDYDTAGNTTAETIKLGADTVTHAWTYVAPEQFTAPYIKNRVATATDGNNNVTTYTYDARGNQTQTARGGVQESDSYADNGDHASHTDGLGNVWLWRYDGNGTPREAEDPLHNITRTTYDDRGRKLSAIDANGHTTTTTYDAQDRVLTIAYPTTDAGAAVQTITYDDAHDARTETNPLGHPTRSSYDTMGRLIGIARADGHSRALHYDFNGNLVDETDFSGNLTSYVYDDANRRTQTHAPEGRNTLSAYDALGHVLSEIVGSGSEARTTEYAYAHPLYKRTLLSRRLDSTTVAEERTQYDGKGNATQTTDPLLHVTTRTFDARDRLTEEAAPLGRVSKTDYDAADHIVTQTLVNPGHSDQVRKREYDAAGRLTATIDATNARRTMAYDNTTHVVSRSDARGNLTRYAFDARDELTQETGPVAGQVTTYGYDLAGNRIAETWANGNVRTLGYDVLERHLSTTDSLGAVESFTYTPDDLVATRTDANGHTTTNQYDGLHRLTKQILPAVGAQVRILVKAYNIHGDVVSDIDPGGHVTAHAYDALGRLVTTTQPAVDVPGAALVFGYDLDGNRTTQSDARGNVTSFAYDALNRRTDQTDPVTADGTFSQHWTYDAAGNALSHIDRRGLLTSTTYDAENRALSIVRDGLTTRINSYDPDGHLATETDALQRSTTNSYDEAGRRIEEIRPLEAKRTWTYTPMGDVATATDADGRTTTTTYTKRRFMDTTSNAAGETTTTAYDGEGHPTSMTRPGGGVWSYSYDAADRLSTVTDPNTATTTYAYDADGNRIAQTDANNHTTTLAYDARHRHVTTTFPTTAGGTASETWTYDADGNVATAATPNGRTITYSVDALNRTSSESVDSPLATEIARTLWHHDGNGNVVAIDETLGDASVRHATRHIDAFERIDLDTDVHGKSVGYGYDAVGNRTTLTDADSQTTAWSYDALNHNSSVTVPGQGTTVLDYTLSGLPITVTRPDGSATTTEYDDAARIASIVHAKGGSELAHETYRYDLDGNRIEQREANGAVTAGVEQITSYTYDPADRLTDTATPERSTHYVLDPVGNRTSEQIRNPQGDLIGNSTLSYDARDQLTLRDDPITNLHLSLSWDADGNQTAQTDASGTRTFVYDAHDRVQTLTQTGQPPLTFDYQSDGLRIAKHQGSAETRYQYDQQSLLAETNAIGNTTARYHYSATQLISRTEQGSTPSQRQYLLDALNTPIALLTQAGAISARTRYDAWGEIVAQQGTGGAVITPATDGANAELPSTDDQAIGFTGYMKDGESGLYYAKARYYDPRIARFTTQDPEGGKPMQPPSLHRYLYAYANPTVYVDPTGKYGEAGHYYTTYYVALRLGFSNEQAQRLAFFSQLPDEVSTLDATEVEKRAVSTRLPHNPNELSFMAPFSGSPIGGDSAMHEERNAGEISRNDTQRDLVQHDLHSLTGGFGPSEAEKTVVAIAWAKNDLDADGILVHRLGDTSAHTRENGMTYSTGLGHFEDGTSPDVIQRRPEVYRKYVEVLVGALGKTRGMAAKDIEKLKSSISSELVEAVMSGEKSQSKGGFFSMRDDEKLQKRAIERIRARIEKLSIDRFDERHPFVDTEYRPEDSGPDIDAAPYDKAHTVQDAIDIFVKSKSGKFDRSSLTVGSVRDAVKTAELRLRYVEGKCAAVGCAGALIVTEDGK